MFTRQNLHGTRLLGSAAIIIGMCVPAALAQDHDREWDRDRDGVARIDPGTTVPVRTNQTIDVDHSDQRVYTGWVDRDVRGENGRVAIPRGSSAELRVRVAADNDLILDLESIVVYGQRYAVRANPDRMQSQQDNSVVGTIVGALRGQQVRGSVVRVPRDSELTFRIEKPMEMVVADRDHDHDRDRDHDRQ